MCRVTDSLSTEYKKSELHIFFTESYNIGDDEK